MTHATETNRSYFFEAYTIEPVTREGGWDIKVGFVMAVDAEQGRLKAKDRLHRKYGFDTFIQFYEMPLCNLGCETEFVR